MHLRQGENIEIIRQLLCHKRVSTADDFYIDTDGDANPTPFPDLLKVAFFVRTVTL
jgi:hypothetical protein